MEDPTIGTSELQEVDSSLPKVMEPSEKTVCEINLDKTVAHEKELSWEKIAAEVVAEDGETQTQVEEMWKPDASVTKVEEVIRETTVEETVITPVAVENDVTVEDAGVEPDTSDIIPDSTEFEKETPESADVSLDEELVTATQEDLAENVSGEVISQSPEVITPSQDGVVTPIQEEANISTISEEVSSISEEVVALPEELVAPTPEEVPVLLSTHENVEVVVSSHPEEDLVIEEPDDSQQHLEKPKGDVEISEVNSEVEAEDLEYTVEEVETHEIIEEHLAQSSGKNNVTERVVIINPDKSQTEITIEQVEEDERNEDGSFSEEIYLVPKYDEAEVDDPVEVIPEQPPVKPKKPRGRKPISDIPLHVLGRDITKPTEGVSNGGRTMPKPRLGVKVPYRNLTSQIVSKQDIEKEIMERFKLKQEQNVTNSGDILFARKLTQRLAKKLIPSEKDKSTNKDEEAPGSSVDEKATEIKNNQDLLAILEGDGDDIEVAQQTSKEEEEKNRKRTEREIALEQLRELPNKSPRDDRKIVNSPKEIPKSSPPQKPNLEKKSQVDIEPRLKTGMVIKTYTRKRKSTEIEPAPSPKKTLRPVVSSPTMKPENGSPGDVYITKSSRIIKRKVIWDPDEIPAKALKSVKSEPGKSVEKKETAKAVEKPVKPVEKTVKPVEKPVKPVEKAVKAVEKTVKPVEKTVKPAEKKESVKPTEKKEPEKVQKVVSTPKKVAAKSSPPPPLKKRLTEVDRLLMDEGAVNMIYDVKNNDEASPEKKKKAKSVISLDRAHKELMSKTSVIKNDLQQYTNTGQKSLRKKEIVSPQSKKETTPSAVTRKKSKDSSRSSPPSSPPYNAAEASRIIRRHSSSSFSSDDEMDYDSTEEKPAKKKEKASAESQKKKTKKAEAKGTKETKEVSKNNNNTVTEAKSNHVDKTKLGQYKSFTATKKNKLAAIKLQNVDGKCYLHEQVLKELTSCLKEISKDDDCHVVSITSDNESFCEGLDYRLLVVEDENGRKKKANELASLVKEFLRCLLNFPKVLVAGIHGNCVGLGVTMLPLFDMVVASDISTFSAPYSRLGCLPEAGFLLTVPHLSSNGLASELFYTAQTIKADDAFRRGLISRLCWPEKYQQELKGILSQVSNQSRQSITATKQQLRQNILQSTEAALSSVSKNLVECWTSPECQKNFAK